MQWLQRARNPLTDGEQGRVVGRDGEQFERQLFKERRVLGSGIPSVVQQVVVQIDFDRARLRAGTTQGAGHREMFPILQAAKMGRDDGPHRTAVSGAVGVATNVSIDRTHVETGTTANAVQCVPLFGVGVQPRAAVVHQDDVKFLRSIGFSRLTRAAVKRVVAGQ